MPIVIRVENTGTRPRELYLRGRTIAFDVFVAHPNGDVVWQRLKDQVIPGIIQLKVLQPGEVFELEEEWLQRGNGGEPLGPGSYVVQGSVAKGRGLLPLLGHSSIQLTLDTYSHVVPGMQERATERLETPLSGTVSKSSGA